MILFNLINYFNFFIDTMSYLYSKIKIVLYLKKYYFYLIIFKLYSINLFNLIFNYHFHKILLIILVYIYL